MNIRMATPGDASAYYDHMLRHFRESGRDGDFIFHPVLDFEEWKKEEHVAKMVEAFSAPVSGLGWQRVWIAEIGGEVVGDVMLRASHMAATAHRCQFGIGIERAARGQGLGRRMSVQAISWARQQPELSWIDLWVFAHNKPAIALYDSLGFRAIDTVIDQFRLHGQKIDDTQMTLALGR